MAVRPRVPVWNPAFTLKARRTMYKRLARAAFVGTVLGSALVGAIYYFELSLDFGPVLDLLVLVLPIVAGLLQWIFPVAQQTREHRIVVLLASIIFSGLIFWQQAASRKNHGAEISQLATKKDIPTAVEVAREFAKLQKPTREPTAPKGTYPPPVPDVVMRFVNRRDPLLVLENKSVTLARDIKWVVALWNTNLPDRDDPLPIPVTSFGWLKGHTESGAQALFENQLVKALIKPGDHLLGSAVVMCAACTIGHTYVVNIMFGTGGWYAEDKESTDGNLLVPSNFHRDIREAFLAGLPSVVPENKRIQIGDSPIKPAKPIFR